MNRRDNAAANLLKQLFADEAELDGLDEPLDMAQVKEDVARWRERFPYCVPVLAFHEDAPGRGWNDAWHAAGHAGNCPQCGSGVLVALRNRAPGLWVARGVERDPEARPLWWRQAVEAYLAEAPKALQGLAAVVGLADRTGRELQAAAAKLVKPQFPQDGTELQLARNKEGERELFQTHGYHGEDAKLRVDFREVKDGPAGAEFVLSVRDSNLRAKREGMLVQTGLITEGGRLDRTLRLKKDGPGLRAEVTISAAEVAEIGADYGRVPGMLVVSILPPELLTAEEADGVVADNDPVVGEVG